MGCWGLPGWALYSVAFASVAKDEYGVSMFILFTVASSSVVVVFRGEYPVIHGDNYTVEVEPSDFFYTTR